MQSGVAQVDLLPRGYLCAHRRLYSREMQLLDVGRAPDIGQRAAEIVDAVHLAPMEDHHLAAQLSAGVPIQRAFIAPGPLRTQVRAAQVGRIVIVEVRIAGNPKRAAHAAAQFEALRKPDSGADAGAELA